MKSVSVKIVILLVVTITVALGVWISIGSHIGRLEEYPDPDATDEACRTFQEQTANQQMTCGNMKSVFLETNDLLLVLENEGLLTGNKDREAWKSFGDAYLGSYLDCKLSHFQNNPWHGQELSEVVQHLNYWKQRYATASVQQVATIHGIHAEYQKYPHRVGVFRDTAQAQNEINQMKQYASNVYLRNCVTVKENVRYFQTTMGNSHIGRVLEKEEAFQDPNRAYGDDRGRFKREITDAHGALNAYEYASKRGRYGSNHPNAAMIEKAKKVINNGANNSRRVAP